jgi:hypothetical protein
MGARILCLGALMLCALGWTADRRTHVGEAVPDDVAVAERGGVPCYNGACGYVSLTTCNLAGPCPSVTVVTQDPNGTSWYSTCGAYCGNGAGSCVVFPTRLTTTCAGG